MGFCRLYSGFQAAACILLILVTIATAQSENETFHVCSESGNYTRNSTYEANLNTLLKTLSSNQDITYGFYNFSEGQGADTVNAIALCRGDVSLTACRSCVNFSTSGILQLCPTQMEAIVWYDHCMLRYSNRSIFGTLDGPNYFSIWIQQPGDAEQTNRRNYNLLYSLRDQAASGNSTLKFAGGHSKATDGDYLIYGLVQCTPDLTYQACGSCLDNSLSYIDTHLSGQRNGSCWGPSCSFRYSLEQFFETAAESLPPSPSPLSSDNLPRPAKGNQNTKVIIIVLATLCFVTLIVFAGLLLKRRMRKRNLQRVEEVRSQSALQFDLNLIQIATDDFSDDNKISDDGFGSVYKGKLPGGEPICVKRLAFSSKQDDKQFKNEVMLLATLRHRNLVRLIGFCLEGQERLLIYEFLPNASLDHLLVDAVRRTSLNWETYYKIMEGIARGLLYLHEDSRLKIIHRDLKASSIFLDQDMCPKITDFGVARLVDIDESGSQTGQIVGTREYMAPEYAMHGQYSVKSDVYSFGILMLELISGQKKCNFQAGGVGKDLITHGWDCWRTANVRDFVDQTVMEGPIDEITRCLQLGLLCVQEDAAARPAMASVVLMLSSYSLSLNLPSKPAILVYNTSESKLPV